MPQQQTRPHRGVPLGPLMIGMLGTGNLLGGLWLGVVDGAWQPAAFMVPFGLVALGIGLMEARGW